MSSFSYNDERHEYKMGETVIPSLTQMLDADGLSGHLDRIPADVLNAKKEYGTRGHLALQKAEYGYGIDEEFKQHCVDWLEICRRMNWIIDGIPIWEICELPRLAGVSGFSFGFTPDRAHPSAVVEIKFTYNPEVSHGIQTALQVLGMNYPTTTPRWVAYFDREGIKKLHPCGPTIKRNGKILDVWEECDRILFEHAVELEA